MQERAELHKTIWKIANDLRGSVDGWEFKAYVLGSIFYRFISENMCDYIHQLMVDAGQPDFNYATISDDMAENIRQKMVEEKGYFILPSQLFQNVVKTADKDVNLNEHLTAIFRSIEASAQGTESEDDLRGLFSDFSVDSQALGSTVIKRNQLLAKVLKTVATMDLGSRYNDTDNDTFGDTYEFLMQMYASEAGKSGGEFFTPQQVSELLARLASWNNPHINKVYDPACGSGSLLLKFAKTVGKAAVVKAGVGIQFINSSLKLLLGFHICYGNVCTFVQKKTYSRFSAAVKAKSHNGNLLSFDIFN